MKKSKNNCRTLIGLDAYLELSVHLSICNCTDRTLDYTIRSSKSLIYEFSTGPGITYANALLFGTQQFIREALIVSDFFFFTLLNIS